MDTLNDNKQRLQNLIDFSQRRREWYQDQNIRIADSQSDQISLLSSISAAILAITSAFSTERTVWVEISFWSLMITVILGIFVLIWLTSFNRRILTKDREMELDILDKLKESTQKAISGYPEYQSHHIAEFSSESEKIKNLPPEHKSEKMILTSFYYLILLSFLLGIFGLGAAWIEKGGVMINMNIMIFTLIILASIFLGYTKFRTLKQPEGENWNWQLKFAEIWNCTFNFLIAGVVAYYFVVVRLPVLIVGENLLLADFLLLLIFGMGVFGHLNVLSLNLTKGIEAILDRVLIRNN